MKIVEKLTKRLDHMVPDKRVKNVNLKEIADFLKALAVEEQRLGKQQR